MALAIVGFVTALAWLNPLVLLAAGTAVAGAGLLGSLAVGVTYHRRLLAAVTRLGAVKRGWWWAPSRLHDGLDESGRRAVLPVWRAGIAVVVVAIAGLVLVAVASAKAYLATHQ